jgi:amino acid transporter
MSIAEQSASHSRGHIGLKEGAIGLGGDLIAAVVNVAPSSSVAFTLALLVSFTGSAAPLATFLLGVAMAFCAVGFARLNRWRASAGAAYLWVGASINPTAGVGTGLLSAVTSTVSNTGNVTLAGSYFLLVIFNDHKPGSVLVWLAATAIVGVMLWVAIKGLRVSVQVQLALMVIEYSIIIAFVILALIHEAKHAGGATLPSMSNFTLSHQFGFKGFAQAAVIASFLYGSWETPSALGEESPNSRFNPGRAMVIGTIFLTIWYTFLIAVFQGVSSQADIISHGSDVLAYAGGLLAPAPFSRLLPFAVLMAVIGTTQMQMISPSRVLYSMSRDHLIPKIFGRIHRTHQTPWSALMILAAIPTIILIPYLMNTSVSHAIGYLVGATGMLYLFLYFVIAVASVWFYRVNILKDGVGTFLLGGVVPLIGGIFCLVMFLYGLKTQSHAVAIVSGVAVVLCYVLGMVIRALRPKARFFEEMAELKRVGAHEIPAPTGPDADSASPLEKL